METPDPWVALVTEDLRAHQENQDQMENLAQPE